MEKEQWSLLSRSGLKCLLHLLRALLPWQLGGSYGASESSSIKWGKATSFLELMRGQEENALFMRNLQESVPYIPLLLSQRVLEQQSANNGPLAISGQALGFLNKTLSEHSHAHLFIIALRNLMDACSLERQS